MADWTERVEETKLALVHYEPDVLGEEHGFGGFLFDTGGKLISEDGWAWLYTTRIVDGRWESWVRRFHIVELKAEPAKLVLCPDKGRDRAVLHHVVAVKADLIVGFYCDGIGVSAAVASAPDAEFVRDQSFELYPEVGWETRYGDVDGWSLESNGGYDLCTDDTDSLEFWQGYDSYRKADGSGELGWAKIRIDKATGQTRLVERHPENPLKFRQSDWLCARCGGNIDSDVRIDGKRPFFFYMRQTRETLKIGLALSRDPLFFKDVTVEPFDELYGDEKVAEKFEALAIGDQLYLFYESMLNDKSWRTGLRIYKLA